MLESLHATTLKQPVYRCCTVLVCLLAMLLVACSTQQSRYQVKHDFSPTAELNPDTIMDAVPRVEPVTRAGNKNPYTVLGKTYHLLPTAKGYKEAGEASWYGLKFHGHHTSNGEVYSIYDMTAAHKTLPIPSYVKVTNTENGRSAIVRVNDRGPFKEGRIIDLSYAAATKLGYINSGTANVVVEAIDPEAWLAEQQHDGIFLQVGAFSTEQSALKMYDTLFKQYPYPVVIEDGEDNFYRVRLGPVAEEEVAAVSEHLVSGGFPKPIRVK